MAKILVYCPSFMDGEITPTVDHVFYKMSGENEIIMHVACQTDYDLPQLEELSDREGFLNLTVHYVDYRKTKGVMFALGMLETMVQPDHDYFFQIDAHTRLDEDWDLTLIQMWKDLEDPKGVLSHYPAQYFLDRPERSNGPQYNYIDHFDPDGRPSMGARPGRLFKGGPIRWSLIAGGFLFTTAKFLEDCPWDPYMNYRYQEIELSIRAHTHGWNIYGSDSPPVYHLYTHENRYPAERISEDRGLDPVDRFRFKFIKNHKPEKEENIWRIGRYNIGTERSVASFEKRYSVNLKRQMLTNVVSIPIAVHNDSFEVQLDLFWEQHKKVYGEDAYYRAMALVLKRNHSANGSTEKVETMQWPIDIPHKMVENHADWKPEDERYAHEYMMPNNIQVALAQVIDDFEDDQVIEILDCDMFHMKPLVFNLPDHDEVFCDPVYENWHLKMNSVNRKYVREFTRMKPKYVGGFVPIILTARTLRKILKDWIEVSLTIAHGPAPGGVKWWGGMYAFNVACHLNDVKVKGLEMCYLHNITPKLKMGMHVAHYSCDPHVITKNERKKMLSLEHAESVVNMEPRLYTAAYYNWITKSRFI